MQGLNRRSWREDPTILSAMQQASHRYGVPLELIEAVIEQESSRGDEAKLRAESEKGALGLMQVLPSTADALPDRQHEIDLFDPYENIRSGTEYLRRMYDAQEEPSWFTALQKYEAGPGNYEEGYRDMYPTEVLARLDAVPDPTLLAGRPELQALLDEPLVTLDPTATDSLFQTLGEDASLTDPTLQDVLANRIEEEARIGLSPSTQAAQELARAGFVDTATDAIDAIAPPARDDPASIEFRSDLSDAPIRGRLSASPTEIGALFPPKAFAGPWDVTLPPLRTERIQPTAEEQAEIEETLGYRDLGILAAQLAAEMGISLKQTKDLRGGAGLNPLKGRVGRPLMHRGVPGRGGKLFGTTPQTMLLLGAVGAAGEAARQAYRGQSIELSSGRTFDPTSYTVDSLYGFGPSIEGVPFANPTSGFGTKIRTAVPGWASGVAETLIPEATFGGVGGLFTRMGDEVGENTMLNALGKMTHPSRDLTDPVNLGTPGPSTPPNTLFGSKRLKKVLYPTEQKPRDFTGRDISDQGGALQTGRVLFDKGEITGESKRQVAHVKQLMEEVEKKTGDDALKVIFGDVMEQQMPLKEIQQVLEANTGWEKMIAGGIDPTEHSAAIRTIRRALQMDAPIPLDYSARPIPEIPQNLEEFMGIEDLGEVFGELQGEVPSVDWWLENMVKASDPTGRQIFTESDLQKEILGAIRQAQAGDEAAALAAVEAGQQHVRTVPALQRQKTLAFEDHQGRLRRGARYPDVYGATTSPGAQVEVVSGRGEEAFTNPLSDLPDPTIGDYLNRLKSANIAASPEYALTTPESKGAAHAYKILGDVYRTALEKKLVELGQPGMLQEWQQARKTSKNLLDLKKWIIGANAPTPIWSGKELGWLGLGGAGAVSGALLGGVFDASGGVGTGAATLGLIGLLRKLGHPYGQDWTGRTVLDLVDALKHYNPANIVRAYRESEVLPEALGGLDFEMRPGSSPFRPMDSMLNPTESITVTARPRDLTQQNFSSRKMKKVQ
tara:strand:+ start:4396 stop:7419 length:3024 start_codon:yes stop_codon:yes gene_type:complete